MSRLSRLWINLRAKWLMWYWSLGAKKIQAPEIRLPGAPVGPSSKISVFPRMVAIERMFSPVDWIMSNLARPPLELKAEAELFRKLNEWTKRKAPLPWRSWSGSGPRGPHASKRRFVEYSPGMFRRVA
jgi:hypothetical protein